MIEAHEAAEAAGPPRRKYSKPVRVLGHALAGLGVGVASGALCGGLFMLQYTPHGGGQIGDWTSILAFAGAVVVGGPVGLIGGLAAAFNGFKLRWLFVALGALGVLASVVLMLANLS